MCEKVELKFHTESPTKAEPQVPSGKVSLTFSEMSLT